MTWLDEPILAPAGANGKLQEARYPTEHAAGQDLQPEGSHDSRTHRTHACGCGERVTEVCVHTYK